MRIRNDIKNNRSAKMPSVGKIAILFIFTKWLHESFILQIHEIRKFGGCL